MFWLFTVIIHHAFVISTHAQLTPCYLWDATEYQNIIASDAAATDRFGYSVSISNEYLIVGAYSNDDAGSSSGSAYIYERDNDGLWTEVEKLVAPDAAANDYFGYSVSISNEYLIVGAYRDDDDGGSSGSAYVIERDNGFWTKVQKITASDAAGGDGFGYSVSISNEYLIVGAYSNDDAGSSSGSAYIFERDNDGLWTEIQKITASDARAADYFSWSVSISNEYLVVGAYGNDDAGSYSGSAYIFERDNNGLWTEVQKITASDATAGDLFGISVSISDGYLAVGTETGDNKAYIFERDNNGLWIQVQKITALDAAFNDHFGASVSISSNGYLVVGTWFANSAYIFERDNGFWTQVTKLTGESTLFGRFISISNGNVVVGQYGGGAGEAFIYEATNEC